jgi:hypothetical protein
MMYSLPAVSLSRTKLESIESKMITAILPKMGYNRNMPREVVFGPYEYGGIGLLSLYIAQGVLHVMLALGQFRLNEGQVANALHIALSWSHRVAGTTVSPLVDVDTPLPHLQKGWIPNTRKFLRESNSKLGFVESENIKQMREHDRVIMQDAVRSPLLTKTEVSEINFCRLYLQVKTIADMATLDGTRIHEGCFADEPACLSTSNTKGPIQGKPGREQWKKFSLYMRRTYCRTEKEWVLRVRLKDWYPEVYQRRN